MLKKIFLTNSSGIFCSRIFGFLRDLSTAYILGAGMYSDIFFAAFKFPNLFRRIFGEGAFTQSFLPNFIASSKKGAFSVIVLMIFTMILLILSGLVVIFSGFFTKLLAWGFSDSMIEMAKPIVVINFWYLILVFFVTFLSSLLQYKHSFWVSAYNTALLNIAMISALFIAKDKDSLQVVYYLSYGVLVGGVAQVCLHFYPLYTLGFFRLFYCGFKELRLAFFQTSAKSKILASQITDDLKSFFKQFFPAMIGSSTAQLASFIDTILASFLASGSISYLYYSNRIFQLPLAIFAIAISSALFPMVAKMIKVKQEDKALEAMKKSFWFLFAMLLFCTIGGIMLSEQIIWLLYEHGEFSRSDTAVTAKVFSAYMIGLLPFGLSRIFSLYLYSYMKQTLAAKISAISLFVGVIFSLILMYPFGAFGLAISGSLSGFVLFFLTIKAFGITKFYNILKAQKFIILILCATLLEIVILSIWLMFVKIPR